MSVGGNASREGIFTSAKDNHIVWWFGSLPVLTYTRVWHVSELISDYFPLLAAEQMIKESSACIAVHGLCEPKSLGPSTDQSETARMLRQHLMSLIF